MSTTLLSLPDVVFEGRFVQIVLTPRPAGKKTDIFEVIPRTEKDGRVAAEIRWYGPWRKYSFFPKEETVWESTCLGEINTFMHRVNQQHRALATVRREGEA